MKRVRSSPPLVRRKRKKVRMNTRKRLRARVVVKE